jgi:hypothetical protein
MEVSMHRIASLVSVALIAGCAAEAEDAEDVLSAEIAVEGTELEVDGMSTFLELLEDVDYTAAVRPTEEDLARFVAERLPDRLTRRDCATITRDGRAVTIDFDDCDAGRDLRRLRGRLIVRIDDATRDDRVDIRVEGDLEARDARRLALHSRIQYLRGQHRMIVERDGERVQRGDRGHEIERLARVDLSWDAAACMRLVSDDVRGDIRSRIDITRCTDRCPTGRIDRDLTRPDRIDRLEALLDATRRASWTSVRDHERRGHVDMTCRE